MVLRNPVAPRSADGPDGVVRLFPPTLERVPQYVELRLQRADADTDDDPALAEDVERAEALHQLERVVIGQHSHVGQKTDPFGMGRQIPQRGEGIPVPPAADCRTTGGDCDVLRASDPIEAELLRLPHYGHHVADGGGRLPGRRVEARIHVQDRRDDAEGEGHGG